MIRMYLAHPYGGLEENKKEIERYLSIFEKRSYGGSLVSPVHVYEKEYQELSYLEGMELCFALLDSCGILMLPEDIFLTSKGCCMEYGYAKANGKLIFFYNKAGEIC